MEVKNGVQWNPSKPDTTGMDGIVRCLHFKETNEGFGTDESVLFMEVSSIQGCPYRGVPLYIWHMVKKLPRIDYTVLKCIVEKKLRC